MGRLQIRGDTTANWASSNPVLAAREIAVDTTLRKLKVGDGVTAWTSLAFAGGGGMWELVERQTVAGSAVTSVTFDELNGDTDRRYMLYARIIGGIGSAQTVRLTCSTDTTASHYPYRYAASLGGNFYGWSGVDYAGFTIGYTDSTSAYSMSTVIIDAITGAPRCAQVHYTQYTTSIIGNYSFDAAWYDNAETPNSSVITQLVATSSASSGIGVGSYIELWKLAQ